MIFFLGPRHRYRPRWSTAKNKGQGMCRQEQAIHQQPGPLYNVPELSVARCNGKTKADDRETARLGIIRMNLSVRRRPCRLGVGGEHGSCPYITWRLYNQNSHDCRVLSLIGGAASPWAPVDWATRERIAAKDSESNRQLDRRAPKSARAKTTNCIG